MSQPNIAEELVVDSLDRLVFKQLPNSLDTNVVEISYFWINRLLQHQQKMLSIEELTEAVDNPSTG